ncbi:MAG: hypothetical protein HY697_03495 [Deltaproteobacteria bacterium]|nr:hypothetical protein [Deltaproteobacteria bacterium]
MANGEESLMEGFDTEFMESYEPESGWREAYETEQVPRMPVYRREHRAGAFIAPRVAPFRPAAGTTGASIQTPAGRASIQFPKPVATQEAVNTQIRELKGEIAGLAASVKKVNETLDKNTAIVDKKINTVSTTFKKSQDQNQMMAILPLLLAQAPTLTGLKLQERVTSGTPPAAKDFTVVSQEVKKDNTALLLLPMMMMGGGMGAGEDSSNMMTMMFMVLALSGGLGK